MEFDEIHLGNYGLNFYSSHCVKKRICHNFLWRQNKILITAESGGFEMKLFDWSRRVQGKFIQSQ